MKKPKLRTTEYIIMDSKKNKDLLANDIIKLQRIKHKGPPNGDGPKPKTTRELLIEFMNSQNKFNKQQLKFNRFITNEVKNLRSDLNTLKCDFNRVVKLNDLKF